MSPQYSSLDKAVKGATKIKNAAPKSKYIEPLVQTTFRNDPAFETVMRSLCDRVADSAYTISFKALLVIHLMMRDGSKNVVLEYLSRDPSVLDSGVSSTLSGGNTIAFMSKYSQYLKCRAREYKHHQIDYVRAKSKGGTRLKTLSVEDGLLDELDSVLNQTSALLKCRFHEEDINNTIMLTAVRFLINDALALYTVLNEGVMNMLGALLAMSRPNAKHSLHIYEEFIRVTQHVVSFLKVARRLESQTMLHVPNIKHAETSLMQKLEEYVNDPDFDKNRRDYLAERSGKKAEPSESSKQTQSTTSVPQAQVQTQVQAQQNPTVNGTNNANLMDLLDGVNNQPMANNPNSWQQQQFVGGPPMQEQMTGTNPFRMTMMPTGPVMTENTNPFLQQQAATGQQQVLQNQILQQQALQLQQQQQLQQMQQMQAMQMQQQQQQQQQPFSIPQPIAQMGQVGQINQPIGQATGQPINQMNPGLNQMGQMTQPLPQAGQIGPVGQMNQGVQVGQGVPNQPMQIQTTGINRFNSLYQNGSLSSSGSSLLSRSNTNPFAREVPRSTPLTAQTTGGNPFRHSMYTSDSQPTLFGVPQQTAWQQPPQQQPQHL